MSRLDTGYFAVNPVQADFHRFELLREVSRRFIPIETLRVDSSRFQLAAPRHSGPIQVKSSRLETNRVGLFRFVPHRAVQSRDADSKRCPCQAQCIIEKKLIGQKSPIETQIRRSIETCRAPD